MVRRVGLGLLALFWGYLFYGVQDLLAFSMGPEFHSSVLLSAGWGVLFLVLVAPPLAAAALRPVQGPTAALVVAADALAVALAAVLSRDPELFEIAAALLLSAWAAAPLQVTVERVRALRPDLGPSLVVAVLGVVPWCAYALTAAATARAGVIPSDDTWGFDHWPVQAAVPLAIALVGLLVATTLPGRELAAWCAGVTAAVLGLFFWAYPHVVGSTSHLWAAAAVLWGVALVASVHLPVRRPARRAAPVSA